MNATLTLLEDISKSHQRMVQLADQLDWDGVVKEWREVYPRIAELKRIPLGRLSGPERAEAARQLATLIEFEKRIAERITPWMDQVQPLLEAFRKYPIKPEAHEGG